jgi:hypothetical protein
MYLESGGRFLLKSLQVPTLQSPNQILLPIQFQKYIFNCNLTGFWKLWNNIEIVFCLCPKKERYKALNRDYKDHSSLFVRHLPMFVSLLYSQSNFNLDSILIWTSAQQMPVLPHFSPTSWVLLTFIYGLTLDFLSSNTINTFGLNKELWGQVVQLVKLKRHLPSMSCPRYFL